MHFLLLRGCASQTGQSAPSGTDQCLHLTLMLACAKLRYSCSMLDHWQHCAVSPWELRLFLFCWWGIPVVYAWVPKHTMHTFTRAVVRVWRRAFLICLILVLHRRNPMLMYLDKTRSHHTHERTHARLRAHTTLCCSHAGVYIAGSSTLHIAVNVTCSWSPWPFSSS